MISPSCPGKLEKIVCGADHRPLAANLVEAAEEELPEASGVFDLTEHRLDDLFSEAVSAGGARAAEIQGHRPGAAAPEGSAPAGLGVGGGPHFSPGAVGGCPPPGALRAAV